MLKKKKSKARKGPIMHWIGFGEKKYCSMEMSLILVIILRVLINNCKCYKCYFLAYETQNPHSIKIYICYKICNLATVHSHFWECTVATLYNILLFLILSLLRLLDSPSHSLILPHNLGIISLPKTPTPSKLIYAIKFAILLQCTPIFESAL